MSSGSGPAGGNPGASLGELAHDLRSSLAAATAYLDLARERVAEGEPIVDADLARIEQSLSRMATNLARLETLAKSAPRGGGLQ